jgi:transcriptional regulator with PAS, ATPase and Fis domain
MSLIKKAIEKVAPTEAEVFNKWTKRYREGSDRAGNASTVKTGGRDFMSVDLGSLSETLFESELFGHKKGAFTDAKEDRIGRFEAAAGGTIFLDEIGNLSLALQAKLLTVLQHKKIVRLGSNEAIDLDVRVISATNRDLRKMVTEGTFREDLLYRINTVELTIPSLYDRVDDIPPLANYYTDKFRHKYQKPYLKIPQSVIDQLKKYKWPGNIRELQHAIRTRCDHERGRSTFN